MADEKLGADYIGPLRTEIMESQSTRMELMKYKLLAVAALGSVGLGLGEFGKNAGGDLRLVLALLPFICLYIDILCCHNNLRILVIGNFLSAHGDNYEKFLKRVGDNLARIWCREKGLRGKACSDEIREIEKQHYPDLYPYRDKAGYFFHLEDWALHYSTILVSALVFAFGILLRVFPPAGAGVLSCVWHCCILCAGGLLGIVLTIFLRLRYLQICNRLFETVKMETQPQTRADPQG